MYCSFVLFRFTSQSAFCKKDSGITLIFDRSGVKVIEGDKTIVSGKQMNDLLCIHFIIAAKYSCYNTVKINYDLWHQRLGLISKAKFLELKNKKMANDIDIIKNIVPHNKLCEPCINGK